MEIKVFLIVGRGVWGVSTAYHLAKTVPRCRIILMEKSTWADQCGPSVDVNKIIRVEYEDPTYLQLAIRAQKVWREDTFWSQFYHAAEKLTVGELESQKRIYAQMREIGITDDACFLSIKETKQRYPKLKGMAYHDLKETYLNPNSGWADGTKALKRTIDECVKLGVEQVHATASRILFNDLGDCLGVLTDEGEVVTATHTIIAAGASTPKLLADSAPGRKGFRVEDRLMASGCVEAVVKLTAEQHNSMNSLPITIHDIGPIYGEVLPPNHDGYLKFASESTFLNSIHHPESQQRISIPPATDQVPMSMKQESRRICSDIFGTEGRDWDLESYRICWDAFAHDGSWIISPLPAAQNLYLATGGSFHSWKFFPILGELVCAMLHGTLDAEMQKKWHWERDMCVGNGDVDKKPEREWRDLVDKSGDDGDGVRGEKKETRMDGDWVEERWVGFDGRKLDSGESKLQRCGEGRWEGVVEEQRRNLTLVESGAGACCV
ncbi:MAG: hypothetical protein Q9182_006395 [Xanthomendoza sp. 2 TL-2023]